MTLRKAFEQLPNGKKLLASAKLRREIIKALSKALAASKMTQSDLSRELGKSRSAVNQVLTGDGNLKIETIAEYLFAMGAELHVQVSTSASVRVSTDAYSSGFEPALKRVVTMALDTFTLTDTLTSTILPPAFEPSSNFQYIQEALSVTATRSAA